MNDNDRLLLFLFALIVTCIWMWLKLRKVNRLNKELNAQIDVLNLSNSRLSKENSKLQAENAVLETEHLKFQLQPHTLGNVVTTINSIAKNLSRGTESLAETLNYILYKGNTHLVSVEEEIDFIRKYIQLNQLLYSDIISARIEDSQVNKMSKYFLTPCIPHLISAYLVENAYKHGDKSHPDFLKIILKLTEYSFEMTVVNRISRNSSENKNGGLGLKNMEKRLELLLNGKYEVTRNRNEHEYRSTLNIWF